jgi:MSHA biogenesis protein MshP
MRPEYKPLRKQRGFSLPLAIFIITVLAVIGAVMVTLSQSGQQATALEIQSIRAFYAAESGAQIGLHNVLPVAGGSIGAAGCTALTINQSFNTTGLQGCTAVVRCTPQTVSGDTYYLINSTGTCQMGGIDNTARRNIEVMAKE